MTCRSRELRLAILADSGSGFFAAVARNASAIAEAIIERLSHISPVWTFRMALKRQPGDSVFSTTPIAPSCTARRWHWGSDTPVTTRTRAPCPASIKSARKSRLFSLPRIKSMMMTSGLVHDLILGSENSLDFLADLIEAGKG